MAYKEERIWLEFDIPKPKGAIEATRCMTMTRQEAIERMAKAIYTFEIIACSHDECGNKQFENCETWKWCKNIAEAALNALLEDKK